jgi:hypothetical protein
MTNASKLAIAVALSGVFSTIGPAAANSELVDQVHILPGQTARLNVAVLQPGPRHCRVTLEFFSGRGERVAVSGPVDLSAGSTTSLDIAGQGRVRAMVRVNAGACQRALQSGVEVF